MSTVRLFMRSLPALGLTAVLLSYGLAVAPISAAGGQAFSDANAAAPQPSLRTATGEPELKRASRVMHARVKSPDGKTLGRVHDLVLTPDLNSISYVAVSSGGLLGIGNTLHAVPWSALSMSVNNTYAISASAQQFKQTGVFRASAWPSSAEPGWTARGQEPAYGGRTAGAIENVRDRRFTRIKGSEVRTAERRNAGDVHDLAIVMDTGRIAYTVISYGGLLGVGSRFVAVPQSAVTLEPAAHVARVDVTPATLHAHSFTPHQWPDLANASYARELDRAFGGRSAEMALGYVPAEGPVAAAPAPKTPPRVPARSTTPSTTLAEPTPADLTGTFNPSSLTAMDGTVLSEGKFKVTSTSPDMLWLRIRTDDGRTVLVNLGPRSYISAQDFYVVRGDRIHLSGSEVAATASGKRVFLPTDITYNNHVLHLRSTTGTPLWEGQTDSSTSATTTSPAPETSSTPGRRSTARVTEPNEPNKP